MNKRERAITGLDGIVMDLLDRVAALERGGHHERFRAGDFRLVKRPDTELKVVRDSDGRIYAEWRPKGVVIYSGDKVWSREDLETFWAVIQAGSRSVERERVREKRWIPELPH